MALHEAAGHEAAGHEAAGHEAAGHEAAGRGTTRRSVVAAVAGLLTAPAAPFRARAAEYPTRPINLVVPVPPGGGSDVFARIVAKGLETALGQAVIPINKPGGGTLIATNYAKNVRADGYTLLWVSVSFLLNTIVRTVDYDPVKDFDAIGMVARATFMLASNPKHGFATVADLIAYAKVHPNALRFGSPGIGNSGQLAGDLLRHMAGISFLDVRYKGTSESDLATMSGEVDFCFESPSILAPNVATGRLTLLGGASETRDPQYPDVQAIAETLPGYAVWPWFGVVGPLGMPEAAVATLRTALLKVADDEATIKRFKQAGVETLSMDSRQFVSFLNSDRSRWAEIASRDAS